MPAASGLPFQVINGQLTYTGGPSSGKSLVGVTGTPDPTGVMGGPSPWLNPGLGIGGVSPGSSGQIDWSKPIYSGAKTPPYTPPSTDTSQPSGPGVVPYKPGPITTVVNDLLTSSLTGKGNPLGQTLYQLGTGQIPPAIEAQFLQNLGISNANIMESMGKVGNRFGTDISRTLATAADQAGVNLSADAMDRALSAIQEIIGLGGQQENLEFAGNQASLDRANQDFLAGGSGSNLLTQLLPVLLGLSGG
jgi:hypothetical protein